MSQSITRHEHYRPCQCSVNRAKGMSRLRCGHNNVHEVYWTIGEAAYPRFYTKREAQEYLAEQTKNSES